MPKVTEAHLEARTRQILDAAATCFSKKGFHHATMHDICCEAELSPGAVYRYFAAKEDIIAAMVDERRREGIGMVEAVKREHHGTLQVLDEVAEAFFSKLEDVQGCSVDISLWAEAQSNPRIKEMIRTDNREISDAFAGIVEHGQRHGEINAGLDSAAVAQVMSSFFHGLLLQKSMEPGIEVWPYVAVIKAMMGGTFWTKEHLATEKQAQKGEN